MSKKPQEPKPKFGFYAVIPRIVRTQYKKLSHAEKWLYVCLKDLCGDKGTCFRTLRSLSEETDISTGSLSKMIPNLHKHGLIHAEKKRRTESGKEVWHITIADIWAENANVCSKNEQSSDEVVQNLNDDVQNLNDEPKDCSKNERDCSNFVDRRKNREERTNIEEITVEERKNDASHQKANVTHGQEATHSFTHPSHSQNKSSFQETKQEEEVSLSEAEQVIYDYACQTIFKAKPPRKTAKLKGECAEIAKHVQTVEQFISLVQHVRALPYIQGQIHLKNLCNELNGWLQSLEAKPSPASSSRGKPTGPYIAQQPTESELAAIKRSNQEQLAKMRARNAARAAQQQEGAKA